MKINTNFRDWLTKQEQLQDQKDIEFGRLIERIDIDVTRKLVTFNNKHENNVDVSTFVNPTEFKIKDIDVISIFKRKENNDKSDGNPLIHALKGNYGWKIDDKSIIELFKQFLKISKR